MGRARQSGTKAQLITHLIKPPDRSISAWKHVLHYMLFVNKRGYEKFPEQEAILFTPMSTGQKTRLLTGFPKRAKFIRSCLKSFWALGLKQNLLTSVVASEPFWNNPRFQVIATPKERDYFSTILDVQTIRDVINSDTNALRTVEDWLSWLVRLQGEEDGVDPEEEDMIGHARRMYTLTQAIPLSLLEAAVTQPIEYNPKENEIVMIAPSEYEDDTEGEYCRKSKDKFLKVVLDKQQIPHDTHEEIQVDASRIRQLSLWNGKGHVRIRGPTSTTFPPTTGWLLDGNEVDLDKLTVSRMTKALIQKASK